MEIRKEWLRVQYSTMEIRQEWGCGHESWQLQQQDDDGDDGSGSMLRLSTAGVCVLRCVAYNVIKHSTYNATLEGITLYVDANLGKCLRSVYYGYGLKA